MGYPQEGLTIRRIITQSIKRAERWHKGDIGVWSPLEWAGAMCGEAGEAANAAKKLKRLTDEIQNINAGDRQISSIRIAKQTVAKEVADTLLYAVLLMAAVDISPEQAEEIICEVFNKKSEEYGFPERLGF